jgi:hypothetical protein
METSINEEKYCNSVAGFYSPVIRVHVALYGCKTWSLALGEEHI